MSQATVLAFILARIAQAAPAANHYIRDGAADDGSNWNSAWDDLFEVSFFKNAPDAVFSRG